MEGCRTAIRNSTQTDLDCHHLHNPVDHKFDDFVIDRIGKERYTSCLTMIISAIFAHLRALGFYDDLRDGAREALCLDLHGRGYLLIADDALRIPNGTKPIFVGLYRANESVLFPQDLKGPLTQNLPIG